MRTSIYFIICALTLAYPVLSFIAQTEEHILTFAHYRNSFGKNYKDSDEHELREQIFNKNLEKINLVNSNPNSTWRAGINHLTDRTEAELHALRGYNRDLSFSKKSFNYNLSPDQFLQTFPESVDWRKKNVVSPVKNQKACGSCWTFSVAAVLESHVAINTGKLFDLSEQELVSCVTNPKHCGGTGGCSGSTQEIGFQYIKENGITTEQSYPYKARDSTCDELKSKNKVVDIEDFVQLPTNDYNALMNAVANIGPVAISVDATDFHLYKSGVFHGIDGKCGSTINHAVTLVGYGTDANEGDYWIVRNSWSEAYGEEGYIRVAREKNAQEVKCYTDYHPEQGSGCDGGPTEVTVCGVCGILADSSYPIGAKLA